MRPQEQPQPSDDRPGRDPAPIGPDIERLLREVRLRQPDAEQELIALDVPVPPKLAEAFGYKGDARYVSFRWEPIGDELWYDDGQRSGTGDPFAFLAFRRHPKVQPHLEPFNLGYSDADAEHCLVLDRELDLASITAIAAAQSFLKAQHPPPPELTPYERQEVERRIQEALQAGWREIRIDQEAIARAMQEQRQTIARLMAWLDAWPHVPDASDGA